MSTLRLARASWGAAAARGGLAGTAIVLTSVLVVWTAYGPLGWGIERVTALLLGTIGIAVALRWRWGVYLVLAYVTIEGAVINALYPALYPLFIKDALLASAYVGFAGRILLRREKWRVPAGVMWPFAFLVTVAALGALNPNGVPVLVTLVGARTLLFYLPLYVLGFHMADEPDTFRHLIRFLLMTSLPIIFIGIYQYVAGPELMARLGEGFERTIWVVAPEATQDFIYRPTSTFAFVGYFGAYLFFTTLLAFAAIHSSARETGRILALVAFWGSAVAVVLQSQRTTWVLLPVAIILMYLLNLKMHGNLRAVPIWAAGMALALAIGAPILRNRLPLLTEGSGIYAGRVEPIAVSFASTLFTPQALIGHGTGTALGAARYVTGQVPDTFESGWYGNFYMFGIWGILAYVWLYTVVLRAAFRGVRAMPEGRRWLASALFVYLVLIAVINIPINYPPTNIYFWLFAGVLAGVAARQMGHSLSPDMDHRTLRGPGLPDPT